MSDPTDPLPVLKAMIAAILVAAAAVGLGALPWRRPSPKRISAGAILGAGLGFLVGCWWLGVQFHWPPAQDQDRLLEILVPLTIAVELIATLFPFRWLTLCLRLVIAAGAARLLLHNSSYLMDVEGGGWTAGQATLILAGLAAALAVSWIAAVLLARRSTGVGVNLALAAICTGAAVTIMYSGYASGGVVGLPLAAALAAAAIAARLFVRNADWSGILGVGVVCLFALLVSGRYFGELTTRDAALLLFAPLAGWLAQLPYPRSFSPRLRFGASMLLMIMPGILALALAYQEFHSSSGPSTPASDGLNADDYRSLSN